MITQKITKDVMVNKSPSLFNLSKSQIVVFIVALIIGGVSFYFMGTDNIDATMTVIFFEFVVTIGFGVVRIQGMSLPVFLYKLYKGGSIVPYKKREGEFDYEKDR